jgi:hypothetical protein
MKATFPSTMILALSTSAGIAQQPAQCRSFETKIALQMTKEGCSSQIDLCTVGTVVSNEPALRSRRTVRERLMGRVASLISGGRNAANWKRMIHCGHTPSYCLATQDFAATVSATIIEM